MSPWSAFFIALVGAWAGIINTIVGSGTLVTFPTLLFFGFNPVVANVSNNIGLVAGGITGAWGYRHELTGQAPTLRRLMPLSLLGSVIGGVGEDGGGPGLVDRGAALSAGRVGAKVADAWIAERGFLHPLPDPLPDTDRRTEVRVTKDGFCRVGDVDYSVPPGFAGRRMGVRVSVSEVMIFSEGTEIARHPRSYVPADVVLAPAHARALRLAREARQRLQAADTELPQVDLARYDALAGVSP